MIGFGSIMLWGGLVAALISLAAYVSYARGSEPAREPARSALLASGAAIVAASAILLYAFIVGRYNVSYVAEYSSQDLPLGYRISAFWAGQEGSFLLWALMGAVMSLVLIRRLGAWEGAVMPFIMAIQAFLLALLVIKSPFALAAEAAGDGQGLNPLLQDPWMAIHPPLIFLGYAALAVPFAFAVAALVRRDYQDWVTRALPWTLFAWVSLGSGIFVGGYWAYRVLGWGGYWGWDPVENASLIPWLLGTALLHGMVMQKTRGSLKRGNLLLSVGCFVAVLYGTFLTRSGVLKDFSVHSFADAGKGLYWTLLGGMVLSLVAPLALLAVRAREIRSRATYDNLLSRDFAFFLGALVLCISAAIVTVGTSAPLITTLFGGKGASLQPGFYNRTHFPVGLLLGILVGIAPVLAWKQSAAQAVAGALKVHVGVAILGAVVAFLVGVHSGLMILFLAAAVFCCSVNAAASVRLLRRTPLAVGGPLSHVGLACMLAGIIGSSVYSRAEKVTLQPGKSAEALGYHVTYLGSGGTQERREMRLKLARGGSEFAATPRMVFSPQMSSWVHSPSVKRYLLQDVYVSPVELRENDPPGTKMGDLGRGESFKAGGYTFTFEKFDVSGQHMGQSGAMSVGAVVRVRTPDGKSVTATPSTTVTQPGRFEPKSVKVAGTGLILTLAQLSVPRIQLAIEGLPSAAPSGPKEEVVVEISNKPVINLLWLGTVLVLIGGLVAVARRARESARADGLGVDAPVPDEPESLMAHEETPAEKGTPAGVR